MQVALINPTPADHYSPCIRALTALLKQHQPKAVAFNGCVVKGGAAQNKSTCITPNALRWIGAQITHITQLSC